MNDFLYGVIYRVATLAVPISTLSLFIAVASSFVALLNSIFVMPHNVALAIPIAVLTVIGTMPAAFQLLSQGRPADSAGIRLRKWVIRHSGVDASGNES